MKLIRITFRHEDGSMRRVILASPNQINVMGTEYLHGKQVTKNGYLVSAPWDYTLRHLAGDGMVWRMIPLDAISYMTPITDPKDMEDDGSASDPADTDPGATGGASVSW